MLKSLNAIAFSDPYMSEASDRRYPDAGTKSNNRAVSPLGLTALLFDQLKNFAAQGDVRVYVVRFTL